MDWLSEAINAEAAAAPEPRPLIEVEPKRVVHIDGDYLAYFAAGGDEMPVGTARHVCADRIEAFRELSGSGTATVHLTLSGSNKGERALAATVKPYQGHRTGKKPKNWAAMRDFLENASYVRYTRKTWKDREADDGIAHASFSSPDPVRFVAIASKDKDMRMLAGRHLDWDTYIETLVPADAYEVTNELIVDPDDGEPLIFGHKWFWMQMLMGDTADHIPGLPRLHGAKCGKKTAAKALAGTTCNREAWDVVARGYHAHYGDGWSDRMAEQACLLWLRVDDAAAVDNFLTIAPLHKAAARLKQRIATQRAQLDLYTTTDQ